ncbi:MAG: DUF4832 domain-containing protein [Chitinivibrionales bacterium]|nr:DUF4832 domain-containing protein [Chitinivibrionales bacterium]
MPHHSQNESRLFPVLPAVVLLMVIYAVAQSSMMETIPASYDKALRNPLKGFTTRGIYNHGWATLAHTYIKWNEIENDESDGINKIRQVVDAKWKDVEKRNVKVIPRVYLHWSGDKTYWPADMTSLDYTSEQFKQRALRLIERLGTVWNTDPRVAFVELGIFGKWGEHHSPDPSEEMQLLIGNAFASAFPGKLISVRQMWQQFQAQPFGEYWDSWAHFDQMWNDGNNIALLNKSDSRYVTNYIGGEAAYNWGSSNIQPGANPTESVADSTHRDFIINTIRWLHCTQLRWIDDYDTSNLEAQAGANLIQQAFGYRYILEKVAFSPTVSNDTLQVAFNVKNLGSAPFYYDWPVEVSLLDSSTRAVVWKGTFSGVDIGDWLPGDNWTAPEWTATSNWRNFIPKVNWMNGTPGWASPPQSYRESGTFKVTAPTGRYILALAVLDPAGMLPSLRFATGNYFHGGRHPIGIVAINNGQGGLLSSNIVFDDPATDTSLHYVLDESTNVKRLWFGPANHNAANVLHFSVHNKRLTLRNSVNMQVVQIVDPLGRVVFAARLKNSPKEIKLDLSTVPDGMYFLRYGKTAVKLLLP